MPVYILKFAVPLGNARHSAQFYIGFAEHGKVHQRIQEHKAGRGAAITRAAVQRNITIEHVLTLPGGRNEERRLKNQKNTRRIVIQHLGYDPEILPL